MPLCPDWNAPCLQRRFERETAFPNKNGKHYNNHTANEAGKTACKGKGAGVPYVSLSPAIRHSTAASYADRNNSEEKSRLCLGKVHGKWRKSMLKIE
jgi:hypothetical protein